MDSKIVIRLITKYALLAGITGAMLYLISPFFSAIVIGVIVAFALEPLHKRMGRRNRRRRLAAAALVLGFSLIILAPATLLIIRGSESLVEYLQTQGIVSGQGGVSPQGFRDSFQKLETKLAHGIGISPGSLSEYAGVSIEQVGGFIFRVFRGFLQGLPGLSLNLVMMLLTIYFGLAEKYSIDEQVKNYSPFSAERMNRLASAIRKSSNTVIMTCVIGGLAQATVFCIGSLIFGTGNVFLIGFTVFLSSFVPIVGTTPITVILVSSYLLSGDSGTALGWLIVGLVGATADNIVKPYVINAGVKIHPFVGFITVVGGMILLGVPGLFLGPFIAGLFSSVVPILLEVDKHPKLQEESHKKGA